MWRMWLSLSGNSEVNGWLVDVRAKACLNFFEIGVCTVIESCSIYVCGF